MTMYLNVLKSWTDSTYIVIDESIRPVGHLPRHLPVAMTERVQRKLEEMVSGNIIE